MIFAAAPPFASFSHAQLEYYLIIILIFLPLFIAEWEDLLLQTFNVQQSDIYIDVNTQNGLVFNLFRFDICHKTMNN